MCFAAGGLGAAIKNSGLGIDVEKTEVEQHSGRRLSARITQERNSVTLEKDHDLAKRVWS